MDEYPEYPGDKTMRQLRSLAQEENPSVDRTKQLDIRSGDLPCSSAQIRKLICDSCETFPFGRPNAFQPLRARALSNTQLLLRVNPVSDKRFRDDRESSIERPASR